MLVVWAFLEFFCEGGGVEGVMPGGLEVGSGGPPRLISRFSHLRSRHRRLLALRPIWGSENKMGGTGDYHKLLAGGHRRPSGNFRISGFALFF